MRPESALLSKNSIYAFKIGNEEYVSHKILDVQGLLSSTKKQAAVGV